MNRPGAQSNSPELTRLQHWFQALVTHPEGVEAAACSQEAQRLIQLAPGQLEKVITRSRALSAAERLAIYANAYHTRLLECLGEVFPLLKRTLGEEGFEGLAFGYLQDYPSRSYTLNELGRHFTRYLEDTRPSSDTIENEPPDRAAADGRPELVENWPDFLIDLARLEWAIYEVFDGPGAEGAALLGADQLLAIPRERWPEAKLTPVVCLQLLNTRFPVNDSYTALRRAKPEEAGSIPGPCKSFVALTRRDYVVRRYNLSRTEYELLLALKENRSVGQAIESITPAVEVDLDELAANLQLWFRNWAAEGFFQAVSSGS
jgi:hypothetical protein